MMAAGSKFKSLLRSLCCGSWLLFWLLVVSALVLLDWLLLGTGEGTAPCDKGWLLVLLLLLLLTLVLVVVLQLLVFVLLLLEMLLLLLLLVLVGVMLGGMLPVVEPGVPGLWFWAGVPGPCWAAGVAGPWLAGLGTGWSAWRRGWDWWLSIGGVMLGILTGLKKSVAALWKPWTPSGVPLPSN